MADVASLPKVAVILGAGANIGIEGPEPSGVDSVWAPPLTTDLFGGRLDTDEWREVIGIYPGADDIADRLRWALRSEPDTDFEELLGRYELQTIRRPASTSGSSPLTCGTCSGTCPATT